MDSKQREFLLSEFIGQAVQVKSSADRGRQGLEGRIIDETKNTFVLKAKDGRKIGVPKKGSSFWFEEAGVLVDGGLVALRPEDRTKALAKKLGKR
ncbi:MAG: ribonuclease P protein subunit [Candidatus Micrarchaeota archaeon]